MGMTFDQMHKKLLNMWGIDVAITANDETFTVADRKLIINTAWWEVADKFPFREKEATSTFSTAAGTRNYDIPTNAEAVRNVSGRDKQNQHFNMDPMDSDLYESVYHEDSNQRGLPTRYVRESCLIRLWPTPDDVYLITVKYWKELVDMLNGVDQPDAPRNWHEIVMYGAAWRGFLELGDISRSNGLVNYQHKLINSAVPVEQKEQQDFRFAGVQVIRNTYDEFIDPHNIMGTRTVNRRNFDTT